MSTDVAVRHDRWPSSWEWFDSPELVRWYEGMRPIFRVRTRCASRRR